jgi:hypothetical protein
MPNWEELAQSMNVPFGGVSALQGSYAGQQYNQPQVTPQMLAKQFYEMATRQVPQEMLTAPVGEQEKGQLAQRAYEWVEPHLFATGGLLAGVGALARAKGLSAAVEMLSKGDDVENVWQKTGWINGKEGKWRFEIDDSVMHLKANEIPKGKDVYLEDIIDHPSLFKQYPELRQIKINRSSSLNGYVDGYIYLKDFDKEHVLHEVQHAIQDIEGFAKGGSSSMVTSKMMESIGAKTPYEYYKKLHGEFEARDSASRASWGPEERKIVRPYSSEVEPKSGWIVR